MNGSLVLDIRLDLLQIARQLLLRELVGKHRGAAGLLLQGVE